MIPSYKNSRPVGYNWIPFSCYKETVDLRSVRDKKTARGAANSATVHSGVPRRFSAQRKSHRPSESQSFVNPV
jgi:hypothetical protein